jgi:hypothetical protein
MEAFNQKEGYADIGDLDALQYLIGYDDHELLVATDSDARPQRILNCRGIKVDTEGIIKVDWQRVTEVMYLQAGILHACRKVYRLYRYYHDSTESPRQGGTARCYNAAGENIRNAVKLVR